MKASDIKDKKVLVYIFEKNQSFLKWIDVIIGIDNNFDVLSNENAHRAKTCKAILKDQNEDILEELAKN